MPVNGSRASTGGSGTDRDPGGPVEGIIRVAKSKSKKAKPKKFRPPTVTPAKLAAVRTALLAEKQSELLAVVDRHDNLVREKFHMETFVTMVDYSPEVAKQDNSRVFQDYKSQYDLLETAAPISASPRKTRSSHAGLLNIAGPSSLIPVAGPSSSISAPLPRPPPVKFSKAIKQKAPDAKVSVQATKGKGKEKALDLEGDESISIGLSRRRLAERPPTTATPRQLRKRPGAAADPVEQSDSTTATETILNPPRKRRKIDNTTNTVLEDAVSEVSNTVPNATSISAPVNGRVLRGRELPPESAPSETPRDPTVGGKTITPVGRVMPHRTAAHRPQVSAPPLPHRRTVPSTPSGVKRVKLLVRRPPPNNLSHPAQRPLPPQFNSSLGNFLGSWIGIAEQTFPVDRESGSSIEVLQLAETEAVLWERVEAMKRAGRWFGSDLCDAFRLSGDAGGISGVGSPFDASTVVNGATSSVRGVNSPPDDAWAAVVRSVVAHGRRNRANSIAGNPRTRKSRGALIAAQVASKIQAYWDGEAAKLEKGRLVEERRLRGVAKSVMKLVVGEWKKAVFHIREQERLKLEAEELKRGHEHLDAILDQSGHILETQQGDLTRGGNALRSRSRSSSVSATVMGWGEEDEEDDGGESDEEDEGENEGETEAERDGESGEVEDEPEQGEATDEAPDETMSMPDEEEEEGEGERIRPRQADPDISMADGEEEEDGSNLGILVGDHIRKPGSITSSLPGPSTPTSDSQADHRHSSLGPTEVEDRSDDDMSAIAVEDMMRDDVNFSSPIRPAQPDFTPGPNPTDYANGDLDPSLMYSSPPPDDPASPDEMTAVDKHSPPVDLASPSLKAGLVALIDPPTLPADSAGTEGLPTSPTVAQGGSHSDNPSASNVSTEDLLKPVAGEPKSPKKEEEEEGSDSEDDDVKSKSPEPEIPAYLLPYAVAPVHWDDTKKQQVKPPLLLRGFLRPYQQTGLEWLASLHQNNMNGILADEMGLGKTIQTISLLAHLACDRGIWGPHLIIVPTSVLLNWEMEFKKFLPGFKILSYHGSTKRRKELRQGWNEKHHFNVCITSYTLASRDSIVFKRKPWYYMILDEAHMIKNFKSQRWNTLLMFRSFRRLLLTGTPLQNNLTELWALLQFLMSGTNFVNLKDFGEWFSNPLEKAIEAGNTLDEDTMQRVTKLHLVLRPYLLRRLKRDVEKELPSKYEHLVLCPLSKRQRFLYDEFMSRAQTRDALQSGVYQKIANILMQLRKVCNHPDLFEVRPIVTSFSMERSAVADFEIKELLLRRRLQNDDEETVNMDLLGLRFISRQGSSLIAAQETRRLDGTTRLPFISEIPDAPPPKDTRTIAGFRAYSAYEQRAATISRWAHVGYLNRLRCNSHPVYSYETLNIAGRFHQHLLPFSAVDTRSHYFDTAYLVNAAVKSYAARADEMAGVVDRFAFVTPAVVALDLPRIALAGQTLPVTPGFDDVLHRASVKLQIAFPDPSLIQYDCGKLQQLTQLLREKKAGGHRILIFTQMTKILDILEIYLNFHGYLYLRLDGATRIEDRQYITERFNADPRVFCFIASSRSGGVGINLTGADTVVFYDSDFNPQMDRQCEDRAHRIGQIRDVHIYRFVSQHTVEEAMLRKANQKRSLDDLVIQKGEFDWRSLFVDDSALTKALGEFDDTEDAHAAVVAAQEEVVLEGQDKADFLDGDAEGAVAGPAVLVDEPGPLPEVEVEEDPEEPEEEEGGSVGDYMIAFVQREFEFFREWKL